jgi:hypothetical protein
MCGRAVVDEEGESEVGWGRVEGGRYSVQVHICRGKYRWQAINRAASRAARA